MLILHIANKNYSSWSLRPWLLMTELGIPFQERLHRFGTDFGFSPTRRVPVLEAGDIAVWDSLAIAEYLAESYPGVWPPNRAARAWARSAAAEMHSGFDALRETCSMSCGQRVALGDIPPALAKDLARLDTLWNDGLSHFGGPWLGGKHFSAVDAFHAPIAFRLQTYSLTLGETATAYARRLLDLPGMRRWYADALAEDFREDAHETWVASAGEILADHRAPAT
ncbi:glutathione S-transferase family protein [Lysobacter pythonis]|uniref:Glutathione S-transferase family protein n=1 Tax=Solilutibacter pythonis TaxID=2483112 RepID=A0A3M2HYL6_9GAMM|nr:glutathione S-transferase family protein [Lysobacter pythonis]RMH94806.1 glutathione S-transferase family protein [Lysobacter pythonis]